MLFLDGWVGLKSILIIFISKNIEYLYKYFEAAIMIFKMIQYIMLLEYFFKL